MTRKERGQLNRLVWARKLLATATPEQLRILDAIEQVSPPDIGPGAWAPLDRMAESLRRSVPPPRPRPPDPLEGVWRLMGLPDRKAGGQDD